MEITNEELNKFCLKNFGTNEPLSRTGEPLKPLLAELVNANLAGMEPRCPKIEVVEVCPTNAPDKHSVRVNGREIVAFDSGHSAHSVAGNLRMALIPLFRSPAPTPPLDVEAIAEKFFKILTVEVCCECGEPRFPQKQKAGDETKVGWPACVNEACVAYGEQKASSAYRCPISEQQREEILSLLRRHIASPAQPEKRDEWVSVKMRLPEIHQTVIFCIDSEEDSQEIQAIVRKNFLGAVDNADYEDIKVRGYTHWRDLEVQPFRPPPQSGKEDQS